MGKYVLGVDFGTLSGRAVLVDTATGAVLGQEAENYRSGVITGALPDGTPLPDTFALADPADYTEVLEHVITRLVARNIVPAEDIIGIGLDVTCSTFIPTDEAGIPLSKKAGFAGNPQAHMKMWKHHHAEKQAEKLTALMNERGESFRERCGGIINAEWMLPKLLEICEEAPEVWQAAANFEEAGDYLVRHLTGKTVRSQVMMGYKMVEDPEEHTPDEAFLEAAHPGFGAAYEKLKGTRLLPGTSAGGLLPEIADCLGLPAGIPAAAANIDAHVAYPALGITEPGAALMILGTSCCLILAAEEERPVPGIFGAVKDGVLPGCIGYEAGQSAVGDLFEWFEKNAVPAYAEREAAEKGQSVLAYMTDLAAELKPGASGLLALDWWNGNRSVLSDVNLSGMILGMTLKTRPEEIFRALIESVAFGMRKILDTFETSGVPVRALYACGGISKKNRLLLQIYADVLNREILVGESDQCSALGSAIFAAVAAGEAAGGYRDLKAAALAMGHTEPETVKPDAAVVTVYEKMYREYKLLHDYFGRGENDVMKRLIELRH